MARITAALMLALATVGTANAQFCFGPVGFGGARSAFGFGFAGPRGAAFGFAERWNYGWNRGGWGWPVVVAPPLIINPPPVIVVNANVNVDASTPNLDDLFREKTGRALTEYTVIRPTGAEIVTPNFTRVVPLPKPGVAEQPWRAAMGWSLPFDTTATAGALIDPKADFETLMKLARDAFENEQYGRVVERLAAALKMNPRDAFAYFLKAQADIARGKFADAAKTLHEGLKLRPDLSSCRVSLSNLYGAHPERLTSHTQSLRDSLAASPLNSSLTFLLGFELWLQGQKASDNAIVAQFLREAERVK